MFVFVLKFNNFMYFAIFIYFLTYPENNQIEGGIFTDFASVDVDGVDESEWIGGASYAADLPINFPLDIEDVEEHLGSGEFGR